MRKLLKILSGLILISAIFIFTIIQLNKNKFFEVQNIELNVENSVDYPAIKMSLKKLSNSLDRYKNQSVFKINIQQISSEIAAQPWIASFEIHRRFPGTIEVSIVPHEIKLNILSSSGKILPLIANGNILESVEAQSAPDLPLVIGDKFIQDSNLRKKAIDLINEIPDEGSFSKKTISEIRFDAKEGFWMTLIKDGVRVKIGEEKVTLKSERISQVIDYMEINKFQARVIDANLSKKVLVRLRKDP